MIPFHLAFAAIYIAMLFIVWLVLRYLKARTRREIRPFNEKLYDDFFNLN